MFGALVPLSSFIHDKFRNSLGQKRSSLVYCGRETATSRSIGCFDEGRFGAVYRGHLPSLDLTEIPLAKEGQLLRQLWGGELVKTGGVNRPGLKRKEK